MPGLYHALRIQRDGLRLATVQHVSHDHDLFTHQCQIVGVCIILPVFDFALLNTASTGSCLYIVVTDFIWWKEMLFFFPESIRSVMKTAKV